MEDLLPKIHSVMTQWKNVDHGMFPSIKRPYFVFCIFVTCTYRNARPGIYNCTSDGIVQTSLGELCFA